MANILVTFFSMSVSGSVLILVLLSCRPLLKDRVSKGWQYYIWLVVLARLLLPFTPQVSLMGSLFRQAEKMAPVGYSSYQASITKAEKAAEYVYTGYVPSSEGETAPDGDGVTGREAAPEESAEENAGKNAGESTGENAGESTGENTGENAGESTGENTGENAGENTGEGAGAAAWFILCLVWLGGGLLLLMRKVTVYQSFVKYVKAGCREVSDVALLDHMSRTGERIGVKSSVELSENHLLSSPVLLGFFRPCIVLPDASLPDGDFQYIIWHELMHYKRRDMFYKWLVQITICLHWFNPLVYRMGKEINRACELSIDEAMIRAMDAQERRAYGDTLLHAMETGGSYKDSHTAVALGESAQLLKERLNAIMKFKKCSTGMKLISFVLVFVFMAGAMAAGAYASPAGLDAGIDAAGGGGDVNLEDQDKAGRDKAGRGIRSQGQSGALAGQEGYSAGAGAEDSRAAIYARQHYQEGDLPQFSLCYALLSEKEQGEWMETAYEDGEIAFFSVCVNRLPAGHALIRSFAEKAYKDNNVSFFSLLVGHMGEEALDAWLAKAAADRRADFQSVILSATGKSKELEAMEAELEKQQLEEYRSYGITKKGAVYYFEGELVGIFLDIRSDQSFVALDMNPAGTANIRVTRDENGKIKEISHMAQKEVEELLGGE